MSDHPTIPPPPRPPWVGRFVWRDGFYLDNVGPLPPGSIGPLVEFIGSPEEALALWGRALALGPHDFGPPVGVRTVLLLEKCALVYFPENTAPWNVQGVSLTVVAELLRP